MKRVFAPIAGEVEHVWTRDIFRNVFRHHADQLYRPEDYINHSLYFEAKTFLHGLLVVEDKLSMAHGLETRVPFLDNDLVEFAMRCPIRLKLNNLAAVVKINENETGNKVRKFLKEPGRQDHPARGHESSLAGRHFQGGEAGVSAPDASWFKGKAWSSSGANCLMAIPLCMKSWMRRRCVNSSMNILAAYGIAVCSSGLC